jgi:MFS family permease
LLSYSVLFGSLFLIPSYLERILGRRPAEAGALLSPIPLALAVMAPISGALTDRFGPRLPTFSGMLISAASLVAWAMLPDTGLSSTLLALGFLGGGLGMFTPPNNSAIMGSASRHRLGIAGGILNMTRSIGTSLGVAMTGAIVTLLLGAQSAQRVVGTIGLSQETLPVAFHETLVFLAALAGLAAVLSAIRGAAGAASTPAQHTAVAESIGL